MKQHKTLTAAVVILLAVILICGACQKSQPDKNKQDNKQDNAPTVTNTPPNIFDPDIIGGEAPVISGETDTQKLGD